MLRRAAHFAAEADTRAKSAFVYRSRSGSDWP